MTLQIEGLRKRFGAVQALDGVSLTVRPGEVFGFLGANGAGKTTTMRIALGLMKPDATLINLARGEVIDEAALFAHLQANPKFTACLDAWWVEPVRHGAFRMDHPFTPLANVIASPHNSASVPAYRLSALRNAAANCRRAIAGEPIRYLAGPDERLL